MIKLERIATRRSIGIGAIISNGKSFDTSRGRGSIGEDSPAPRRPSRDALARVGADLSAPHQARRNLTVLPIVSVRSPGRLPPVKNGIGALTLQGRALPCTDAYSHRPDGNPIKCGLSRSTPVGQRSGSFDQGNRWHHHDGLTRTGASGVGRTCAVWSIRGAEKPSVSNDLALDLAPATDGPAGGFDGDFACASHHRYRAAASDKKKDAALLSARQPAVLVLDDPGCDRSGHGDRRPNDDRQRGGPGAYTLSDTRDQSNRISLTVTLKSL
jgi:hypothetical protein